MVTERDRVKMRQVGRDLAAGETAERGSPGQRQLILEHINTDRVRHGAEPLVDRAPEESLYDRAKSLGGCTRRKSVPGDPEVHNRRRHNGRI